LVRRPDAEPTPGGAGRRRVRHGRADPPGAPPSDAAADLEPVAADDAPDAADGPGVGPDDGPVPAIPPFAGVGPLSDDLQQAVEAFKLAILRHKHEGWRQVRRDDVLASLDALRALAVAP
jgi:hypothetical protein